MIKLLHIFLVGKFSLEFEEDTNFPCFSVLCMVKKFEKRQIGHLFDNITKRKRGFKNVFESDYFFHSK